MCLHTCILTFYNTSSSLDLRGAPGELLSELLLYPSGEQAWGEAFWEPLVEDSGELLPAQVKAA